MTRAQQPATLVIAGLTAAYGLVIAVVNARYHVLANDFTPRDDLLVFGGDSGFPDDFGRNVFAGTVGLGLLLIVVGLVVALTAGTRLARPLGVVVVVVAFVLVATFSDDGSLLGAKPSAAAVLLAVAFYLLASSLPEPAEPTD